MSRFLTTVPFVLWLGAACSPAETSVDPLLEPEPGALAREYRAATMRLRLLGVQPSDSSASAFGTVMDLSTFVTRNVRIGDVIGRRWRVSAIESGQLTLRGAKTSVILTPGLEAVISSAHHWTDDAIVYRGKNRWEVGRKAAANLKKTHGLGASAEKRRYYGGTALQLTHVAAGSLLSRLDLAEGDFLVSLDGEPIGDDGVVRLVDRLIDSNRDVAILERNRGGIAVRCRLESR